MKKTLQEYKEIAAKEYGYNDFKDAAKAFIDKDLIMLTDLANKMYYEQSEDKPCDPNKLDCPYDFTSRCTMGSCDCKPNPPKQ